MMRIICSEKQHQLPEDTMANQIRSIREYAEAAVETVLTIGHPHGRNQKPGVCCQEYFWIPIWVESTKAYKIKVTSLPQRQNDASRKAGA